MKALNLILFSVVALAASGAVPSGYYDSLTGLTGVELRKAAKAKVASHTVISYGDNTWDAFKKTDVREVNGRQVWWDMYSNDLVEISSGHGSLNIEHSVANSWWGKTKNNAYKDIVHLNPSNSSANSRKGNYPLTELKSVDWDNGVTFVGVPATGQGGGSNKGYEPADEYKGDFARVFMYMFTVYDDISWADNTAWMYNKNRSSEIFQTWAIDLLLKWHRQDPVSDKERARNEAIYGIQHNRNPYIDMPELAEYVWGSKRGEAFTPGEVIVDPNPSDPDPSDPDPVNPDPIDPVGKEGTWTLVQSGASVNADDEFIILAAISGERPAMSFTISGTSTVYFQPTTAIDVVTEDGIATVKNIPADIAVVKFEEATAGKYYIHAYDVDGESKGYLSCTDAKKMKLTGNSSDPGTLASVSITSAGADIVYGSDMKLQYNASSPRFTTYTSNQKGLELYRLNQTSTVVEHIDSPMMENAGYIFTMQGVPVQGKFESLPAGLYIVVKSDGRSIKVNKLN